MTLGELLDGLNATLEAWTMGVENDGQMIIYTDYYGPVSTDRDEILRRLDDGLGDGSYNGGGDE